jgi:hypothetical protein
MISRTKWIAALGLSFLATPAWAQPNPGTTNFGSPQYETPFPFMWGQHDEGFYFATEAVAMRINSALRTQIVARRGLRDYDGSIHGQGPLDNWVTPAGTYITTLFEDRGTPGQILGSGDTALTTTDAKRDQFTPGERFSFGYRFRNGMSVELSVMGFAKSRATAFAGVIPQNRAIGNNGADGYLFGDYFNFSPYFAGPTRDVISDVALQGTPPGAGNTVVIAPTPTDWQSFGGWAVAAYGITNGAEFVSESEDMGFHTGELNLRVPVSQFEGTRTYWTGGFRYAALLEKFRMRWEDNGIPATSGGFGNVNGPFVGLESKPEWSLRYTVKNKDQFYGLQTGVGGEAYLFNGFAVSVDTKVGILAETTGTSTVLQRLDLIDGIGIKHTTKQVDLAGMFEGGMYLWWYPCEGVAFRVGYEYLGIVGAKRMAEPIDYDWGRLNPRPRVSYLSVDGISAGVEFIF